MNTPAEVEALRREWNKAGLLTKIANPKPNAQALAVAAWDAYAVARYALEDSTTTSIPTAEDVETLFVLADSATRDKCSNDSKESRHRDALAWQAYYTARDALKESTA
jgi:dGTP triphosphohydrolase